ncbi:MAG TPA: hypothetical protein VK891_10420, partial [Euzebyales bacterium]|nr:hypothetical protein [Euzebyales bacterium]
IEVRIAAETDGRTRFELEHTAHVDDERWAEFGPGAAGVGWDLGLLGLDLHLSSGEPVDQEWRAAWETSDEAREFMTQSSQQWRDASIAAGEEPVRAQDAADRTTAFYTGTAPDESPGS